jgi:acetyl-CoA C-acetyltransferase
MTLQSAYLVAARRTVLGRPGGIHRHRRVEDLGAPVIVEALKDAGLAPARVGRVVLGNTSAGGNPARLVALAAGIPESVPATTIDQQCASGLEAMLGAMRLLATGEADVVVAGGVEALSMAPWRVAKPKNVHQTPRFLPLFGDEDGITNDVGVIAAADRLAKRRKISREAQDEFAFRAHLAASLARDARRFVKEIVALETTAVASRDESAVEPPLETLAAMAPLRADGTLTPGNTSQIHEGAAIVVAVSQGVWEELGKPPAMRLLLSASIGVAPAEEVEAPLVALRRLIGRDTGLAAADVDIVEVSERSAVQAIVLRDALGLASGVLNPDGGSIVRGHALAAAGSVLVTRLFTRMARAKSGERRRLGAVALGASGGLGVAALFEAV